MGSVVLLWQEGIMINVVSRVSQFLQKRENSLDIILSDAKEKAKIAEISFINLCNTLESMFEVAKLKYRSYYPKSKTEFDIEII